jgi:cephalosporin-C deacetylase-like acetyl esterase
VRKLVRTAIGALTALVMLTGCATGAAELAARTDRPDALYEAGETATFLLELARDGRPVPGAELSCELSTDGFWHSETRRVATGTDGRASVEASREEPCVLWLRATDEPPEGEPVRALAGAAFSPEGIRPSMPPPGDFDAFWQEQLERLARVPMNPVVERMGSPVEGVELYRVTLDNVDGTRIHGYLARPAGEGPLPGLLQLQWAGVYSLEAEWIVWRARQGFLILNINAHAIENGRPEQYYRDLENGPLAGYFHQGRGSRETSYFLRMYLSCVRAAEYLASRPDWDGEHLIATGGSQGGGQAIVTAALSPHVTAVAASVPAMCDHTARVVGRAPGWPMLVQTPGGEPDPAQLQAARYFDVVNFAREVRVPALVGTAFGDLACPASSVYAAYNALAGPKAMVLDPLDGHVAAHENYGRAAHEFIRWQAGMQEGAQ